MNNKWIRAALPALLLHVSIGTVYCWSTFKQEIATYIGESTANVEWAFSFAIFFLGMSAAFLGKLVEKNIKLSALLAAIFFASGMFGTALSIYFKSLIGIYIFYGFVMGVGLGIGYLTPVKNLMIWFDKNKGLGTGLAVAGFGLAKVIASPIMEVLLQSTGLSNMFIILGVVYLLMMLAGFLIIKRPQSYLDAQKQEQAELLKAGVAKPKQKGVVLQTIKQPVFIGIWFMFFLNITCGLALISQEKDILKIAFHGINMEEAIIPMMIATVLAINAAFNALGRLGFSALSDRFKHREVSYLILFAMSIIVTVLVLVFNGLNGHILWLILPMLFLVNAGYGGGFSTLPVLLHEHFGMKNVSTIHGLALSAWAIAGLTGNQLASLIVNTLGLTYTHVVLTITILYVIAGLICLWIYINSKRKAVETSHPELQHSN